MIRCPDNQINASFIDISRIKWLVFFLLWSSFFRTTSTVASSEAPADYQPAPGRTDGVPERHQRQWIINPSLQICAWRVDTASGKTLKKRNACLHTVRQAVEKIFAGLNGLRSEGVLTKINLIKRIATNL